MAGQTVSTPHLSDESTKSRLQEIDAFEVPQKLEKDSDIVDVPTFGETEEVYETSEYRKLLWKIDLRILPVLGLLYMLQFLDKTTISYASVMGIIPDTGLVGKQYNWLGSAFYIGYLVAEYPANLLLQRLPISKFLSSQIIIWGVILMLHAACKNFGSLFTVRILLGAFESSITPTFVLIVSQWWRKEEQGFRTGIWLCCNGFGQILGASVAYGIALGTKNNESLAISGWRIMFLFTGGLTILCGILFYIMIPDSVNTARWLSSREKRMALERIRANHQGTENKQFKVYQMREAVSDPMTYLFFAFAILQTIPNGVLTNFKNVIIHGLGVSKELSLLYGAPNGAVQVISILSMTYLADRTKNRLFCAIFSLCVSILGFILLITLPKDNLGGNLAAYYLTSAYSTSFTLVVSLISSNVAGKSKKTVVNTFYFIGYCVGNLIGPQIIDLNDGPRFIDAKIIICALECGAICVLIAMRYLAKHRNIFRDRHPAEVTADHQANSQSPELLDLTDRENVKFRYML